MIVHYSNPSIDTLLSEVFDHHKRHVIPKVARMLHQQNPELKNKGLIMEGSAFWPDYFVELKSPFIKAAWLKADDALIEKRIFVESEYDTAT